MCEFDPQWGTIKWKTFWPSLVLAAFIESRYMSANSLNNQNAIFSKRTKETNENYFVSNNNVKNHEKKSQTRISQKRMALFKNSIAIKSLRRKMQILSRHVWKKTNFEKIINKIKRKMKLNRNSKEEQ